MRTSVRLFTMCSTWCCHDTCSVLLPSSCCQVGWRAVCPACWSGHWSRSSLPLTESLFKTEKCHSGSHFLLFIINSASVIDVKTEYDQRASADICTQWMKMWGDARWRKKVELVYRCLFTGVYSVWHHQVTGPSLYIRIQLLVDTIRSFDYWIALSCSFLLYVLVLTVNSVIKYSFIVLGEI